MGGKDSNYQIVYRGETLNNFVPGGYVFFQRPKKYGGGYWLGRTHEDGFEFLLEEPTSLGRGLEFLISHSSVEARFMEFVDDAGDFKLT